MLIYQELWLVIQIHPSTTGVQKYIDISFSVDDWIDAEL